MGCIEDFELFTGPDGLVAPTPGGGSLNGVLYTSIALIVMKDNGVLSDKILWDYLIPLSNCFKQLGLVTRTPDHHSNQEGPDDYIGILAASNIIGLGLGESILNYGYNLTPLRGAFSEWLPNSPKLASLFNQLLGGIKVRFNYNNVNPGVVNKGSWLGRMIQFRAHAYYSNNIIPSLFQRIFWALVVIHSALTTKSTDQDGWMLAWLLVRTAKNKNLLARIASWIWWKKMYKVFPNGFRDLNYLNNGDHPITKYWCK